MEGLFLEDLGDETWEILATTRGKPAPESGSSARDCVLYSSHGGKLGAGLFDHYPTRPTISTADRRSSGASWSDALAPYFRKGRETDGGRTSYQTIFAHCPGSIAAPTAGLHFSEAMFHELAARGISRVDLTLHVGIGTFRSIEAEDIDNHVMHSEWPALPRRRLSTLGPPRLWWSDRGDWDTSARTLETAAAEGNGRIIPFMGNTSMFIQPGHVFRGLDALVTNFHLPRSSLLVLVSALAGVG